MKKLLTFLAILAAPVFAQQDWVRQINNKPFLDVRYFVPYGSTELSTAINNCFAALPNGGTCSMEAMTGSSWTISSTVNVTAGGALKVGSMKITAGSALDTCMINLAGDNAEVYGLGSQSWLHVNNSNYNINTICGQGNNLAVHDLQIDGPPHWLDESRRNLGNAVFLGCFPYNGVCANDVRYSNARVYNNFIKAGNNGIILGNIDGGMVNNNHLDVADRTGSGPAPGCIGGPICLQHGSGSITLTGGKNSTVSGNYFTDVMDWRMSNAGYDVTSQTVGTFGGNIWSNNTGSANFADEIFNSSQPNTLVSYNNFKAAFARTGVSFVSNNGSRATGSSAIGNSFEIADGPSAEQSCFIMQDSNTSGTTTDLTYRANRCKSGHIGFNGFSGSGSITSNFTISNNYIEAASVVGAIQLFGIGLTNGVVSDNTIRGSGIQLASGITNIRVTNNDIRTTASHCIQVQANGITPTSGHIFKNNIVDACGGYGIALSAAVTDVKLDDNTVLTTVSGPYLYVPGQVTYTPALDILAGDTSKLGWLTRSSLFSPADGQISLTNNVGTDFTRFCGGPCTAGFPAWQRNGAGWSAVVGDGSIPAAVTTGNFTSTDSVTVGTNGFFAWNSRFLISSPTDGALSFTNSAANNFLRLNLGPPTASFLALVRNAQSFHFRLGDQSADASILALNGGFSGNLTAVQGTFSGALNGTTGTFSGNVSGLGGLFTGPVTGTTGTFSGAVGGTTGTFSGLLSSNGLTSTGAVQGTLGTFSGAVSGTTGTFTGNVSGLAGTFTGNVNALKYLTATDCASSGSPAVCGSASAGSVVIAVGATSVVVNTTAVTANSEIFVTFDSSLGTKLGVTCNTTPATVAFPSITARSAATSFTLTVSGTVGTNPACWNYKIIN